MKGRVTKWLESRGYGFIDVEGQKKDIYVHNHDVKEEGRNLRINNEVDFEVKESNKGPKAVNVEIA